MNKKSEKGGLFSKIIAQKNKKSQENKGAEAVEIKEQPTANETEAQVIPPEEREILVSVIVPIYNACRYLRPAMESLMSQTLRDIEIICVDDGSTDTSLDMVKIFQQSDDRIRIITETNAGPGIARNNGLKRARGEYVAFLDADDFYDPDMLEVLYNCAKEKDLDIAICKYDIFDNKKANFRENVANEHAKIFDGGVVTSKNEYPDFILESTTGAAWNKLFKRSFILEKGITFLPEIMMFEDIHFTVSALAFAERVARVDDVLIHHRIYRQQSRVRTFRKYFPHVPVAFEKTKEFLMKGGMYEPLFKGFLNLSCNRCYHIYTLLKPDERSLFWNMLHDQYSKSLGWDDAVAEDFEKKEICEWQANVEMYTFEQFKRRTEKGIELNTDRIDQALKQNKRRKKIHDFFAKIFCCKKKKNKESK
ncbi:MAG: glycosyltransferase [Ruminococcaceae bacterium]|nr:glycosyltransferase [Oscillospiraceae bacterium]